MTSETPVLQSSRLASLSGVRHAFFTRRGGVSTGLYDSLNVGRGSGDQAEAVEENRRRIAAWFGAGPSALATVYQTHSAVAHAAEAPWAAAPEGDAIATAAPGLICAALSADCAPVLIADPVARVVASVHAGWRGAIRGVVASAVEAMAGLGARREHMIAAVGPCIGPESYEVGLDFLERFAADAPANDRFFRPGATPEKRLFDLPAYVLARLQEAGVSQTEWIGRDTRAEEDLFFSNRRAVQRGEADYGRLMSAIMLTA
ncbi:MAG TPA: peptidoglycan editing factor PgeF [Caulobacteraceae bacterium]|nr:peptidoglycan editing factor PgeF [Caulobacteraceae bacterium]